MAIWQWGLHLIPHAELQRVFSAVPNQMDWEVFASVRWWQRATLPDDYRARLSALAPVGASWCDETELWGEMDGDRIEVCRDENAIDTVYIRINVAALNATFIAGVASFAQACECLIFAEAALIKPTFEKLQQAISQSEAARFVANPHQFLADLS